MGREAEPLTGSQTHAFSLGATSYLTSAEMVSLSTEPDPVPVACAAKGWEALRPMPASTAQPTRDEMVCCLEKTTVQLPFGGTDVYPDSIH